LPGAPSKPVSIMTVQGVQGVGRSAWTCRDDAATVDPEDLWDIALSSARKLKKFGDNRFVAKYSTQVSISFAQ